MLLNLNFSRQVTMLVYKTASSEGKKGHWLRQKKSTVECSSLRCSAHFKVTNASKLLLSWVCIHFLSLPAPYVYNDILISSPAWNAIEGAPPLKRGHSESAPAPILKAPSVHRVIVPWTMWEERDWGRGAGGGTRKEAGPFSFQRYWVPGLG